METIQQYLTDLGSEAPVPGGGSAATIVAAMRCRFGRNGRAHLRAQSEICRPRGIGAKPRLSERRLRSALSEARDRDERAFAAVRRRAGAAERTSRRKAERARVLELALGEAADDLWGPRRCRSTSMRRSAQLLEARKPPSGQRRGCAAEFGFRRPWRRARTTCASIIATCTTSRRLSTSPNARRYETEADQTLANVRAPSPRLRGPAILMRRLRPSRETARCSASSTSIPTPLV